MMHHMETLGFPPCSMYLRFNHNADRFAEVWAELDRKGGHPFIQDPFDSVLNGPMKAWQMNMGPKGKKAVMWNTEAGQIFFTAPWVGKDFVRWASATFASPLAEFPPLQ